MHVPVSTRAYHQTTTDIDMLTEALVRRPSHAETPTENQLLMEDKVRESGTCYDSKMHDTPNGTLTHTSVCLFVAEVKQKKKRHTKKDNTRSHFLARPHVLNQHMRTSIHLCVQTYLPTHMQRPARIK